MIVLSGGIYGADARCKDSVRRQTLKCEHRSLSGPAPLCEKLVNAWRDIPDDEIIVWLDGDDYLAHDRALETVQRYHDAGAWVTYGQFIWEKRGGAIGFGPGRDGPSGAPPRRDRWYASLLRTFRAGLAKRIRDDDMRDLDGGYAGWVPDQRVMLAVLEMAGPRAVFVPQVLAVYTGENDGRPRELQEVAHIRAMKPYDRVMNLSTEPPPG